MSRDADIIEIGSCAENLRDDHYGVYVENDMDARRLDYLVKQIGVEKLTSSVNKYRKKYPNSQPFVSHLLKWHRLRVPVNVYAPTNVPIYRVYILVHLASSTLKIGYSGDWLTRVRSFSRSFSYEGFDLDRSIAFGFYGNKRAAKSAENMAKLKFHEAKTSVPEDVPYGAGGHKEWFRTEIYDDAKLAIGSFESSIGRSFLSLREAVALDIRGQGSDSCFTA